LWKKDYRIWPKFSSSHFSLTSSLLLTLDDAASGPEKKSYPGIKDDIAAI
jgi:hypothetical protein